MRMQLDRIHKSAWIVLALSIGLAGGLFASGEEPASVTSNNTFELGDGIEPLIPGVADIIGAAEQPGPDWADLFYANGALRDDYPFDQDGNPVGNGVPDYVDLYGGQWAVFSEDDISLGIGFESTALSPDGGVFNSVVDAQHDLGLAYVYSTTDASGDVVLYGGIERLDPGDSFVEFEFNQMHHRLGHGGYGHDVPWEILGERMPGDLLVRLRFVDGRLDGVVVKQWGQWALSADRSGSQGGRGSRNREAADWKRIGTILGEGCDGPEICAAGNGVEIDGGPWGPEPIARNRFIEFGLNVGMLLDEQPDYDTIQIRTPQDIVFGYFKEGN